MQYTLIIRETGHTRHHHLTQQTLRLGRDAQNDIVLSSKRVSRFHALLSYENDSGWILEDRNSHNGTAVNHKRIHRHLLQRGDIIELGDVQLEYTVSNNDVDDSLDTGSIDEPVPDSVMMQRPSAAPDRTETATPENPIMDEPVNRPAAHLEFMAGIRQSQRLPLDKPRTPLGKPGEQTAAILRYPNHDVLLLIESSRRHRLIINNEVVVEKSYKLVHGDEFEIAGRRFKYLAGA